MGTDMDTMTCFSAKKWLFVFLLFSGLVFSSGDEIEEGRKLVESGVDCNDLTDDELEAIGDYIMELMHPGEQHEFMDRMMGGEGSESLRQAHMNMAYRFYCDRDVYTSGGMMGSGMGGMHGMGGMMGYGSPLSFFGFLILDILVAILLTGLIILVYLLVLDRLKGKSRK
jgi:hypothetical protein